MDLSFFEDYEINDNLVPKTVEDIEAWLMETESEILMVKTLKQYKTKNIGNNAISDIIEKKNNQPTNKENENLGRNLEVDKKNITKRKFKNESRKSTKGKSKAPLMKKSIKMFKDLKSQLKSSNKYSNKKK